MELKQEILQSVEALSDRNFIFATTQSSLSISEIASVSKRLLGCPDYTFSILCI